MKRFPVLMSAVLLCALSTPAQEVPKGHMSPPPAPLDPERANPPVDKPTLPRRVDYVRLQQEADDLARTAQTIPSDVASVRRGVLPKDVVQKLKQIEKLSKHLRSELNP